MSVSFNYKLRNSFVPILYIFVRADVKRVCLNV